MRWLTGDRTVFWCAPSLVPGVARAVTDPKASQTGPLSLILHLLFLLRPPALPGGPVLWAKMDYPYKVAGTSDH
ncbi:unnamed protein product [Boreogadus saida]